MARASKTKAKGKQFTNREIILLIVLGFAGIIYFYFTYFMAPITQEIDTLKADTDTLKVEYAARKSLIGKTENFLEELEEYDRMLKQNRSMYFKTSNQEHFIKVLEVELLDEEELDVSSLSFTDATPTAEFLSEETASVDLTSSVVSFPFSGTYESLEELIRRLEGYQHLIRINSLYITHMAGNTAEEVDILAGPHYQGNINIEFFTIPQDYVFPWREDLPSYENADGYTQGLFQYDDGNFGIPPFLVEREEAPADEDDGEYVFVPVEEEDPTDTGNEETPSPDTPGEDPEEDPDEEEDPAEEEDPMDNQENGSIYAVKPGDTIFSISMRFYGSQYMVKEIMDLNEITDPTTLQSGATILLPLISK